MQISQIHIDVEYAGPNLRETNMRVMKHSCMVLLSRQQVPVVGVAHLNMALGHYFCQCIT